MISNNHILINKPKYVESILQEIKKAWYDSLHILADFDRTLTKSHDWEGKARPSLISVLRSEGYINQDYSDKAHALYEYYHPKEIDPSIPLAEKKNEMTKRRRTHMQLLVDSWLHQSHIDRIINTGIINLRPWVRDFLLFLKSNNIPLVIISANALWADSIRWYLYNQWLYHDQIHIIANRFVWDTKGFAIDYDKRVIHTFNKDETILHEFPDIYKHIALRRNVILLGDSLGDVGMIEGFDYDHLLRIWFLNEEKEKLLTAYQEAYDIIFTDDDDARELWTLFS